MSRYSYIKQQIENYRATLKQIEEKAGLSPEDEGLKELRLIFANRIASLETALSDRDHVNPSARGRGRHDYRDAA